MKKRANAGYVTTVLLLMFVLPGASLLIEASRRAPLDLWAATGKWLLFWAIGWRLLLAGVRQVARPAFTAQEIFDIRDPRSQVIVRELGFANVCTGLAGIVSLGAPSWRIPTAFIGGLYYGLAGIQHLAKKPDSANEVVALVTDLYLFLVVAAYVIHSVW